jgi:hypothetical protein
MKFTALATSMLVASASAFAPASKSVSSTALNLGGQQYGNMGPPAAPMVGGSAPAGGFEMFSPEIPMKRIEGGGTVRTWDIPPETERLQYVLETNGRPLKAKVELYVKKVKRIE